MQLNDIQPAIGSTHYSKRVGRGIGSGLGKTCTRGHKGQKSRAGGFHKIGFEGGQMPIQRRLPKRGFNSLTTSAEVRLSELNNLAIKHNIITIDLKALILHNIIPLTANKIRIIKSGMITKSIEIHGIEVTAGAKIAIEAAGGKILTDIKSK